MSWTTDGAEHRDADVGHGQVEHDNAEHAEQAFRADKSRSGFFIRPPQSSPFASRRTRTARVHGAHKAKRGIGCAVIAAAVGAPPMARHPRTTSARIAAIFVTINALWTLLPERTRSN